MATAMLPLDGQGTQTDLADQLFILSSGVRIDETLHLRAWLLSAIGKLGSRSVCRAAPG